MTAPKPKQPQTSFAKDLKDLRELWFHERIAREVETSRRLHRAIESAWLSGAITTLGFALGYNDDDPRARAMFLMRQAAARLAELQEENDHERSPTRGFVTPRQLVGRTTSPPRPSVPAPDNGTTWAFPEIEREREYERNRD